MFEAFGFPIGIALVIFGLICFPSRRNDEYSKQDFWFGVVLFVVGITLVIASTGFDLERLLKLLLVWAEGSALGVLLWPIMFAGPLGVIFYVVGLIWLFFSVADWLGKKRK